MGITVTNGTGNESRIDEGDQLTADMGGITGQVDGYAIPLSCQWYRGSAEISGATGHQYTVTAADADASLSVRVTASGNYSGTLESAPVEVGKTPLDGVVSIISPHFPQFPNSYDIVGKSLI